MKHIQNNQKSIGKSKPAYGFKNLRKKSANQKYVTLGYGFKNLRKIYSIA
jgi:hypothetical protein